jgi:hypothetical protein
MRSAEPEHGGYFLPVTSCLVAGYTSYALKYYDRLHEHALGAAASFLLAVVHIHGLGGSVCARGAAAASRVTLHLAVISSDLSHDIVEGLVDIDSGLGGGFDKLAAE